jgi:predicted RNA-binding Zn ribbon-like protein
MNQPLEDRSAPGRLELVRAFVNTRDIEAGVEELDSPVAATGWLRSAGLLEPTEDLTTGDYHRVIAAREALRALLVAHANNQPAHDAIAELNAVIDRAGLRNRLLSPDAATIEVSAQGVDAALGELLTIVLATIAAGTWSRLKACRSANCHWAFYDASKNRSSRWCYMRLCGAQAKREAFRRRHQATPTTGA